ncbi:MAG: carboxypeptidase regulatory-like domain-containing protein [Bacteroidales bacterium]|nr:carboxypeptidase regulatory-like domain-containing protein [Bacteroidales bacterium]
MKKLYKNYLMIICLVVFSILSTNINAQHFNFEGGNPSEPFWTLYIAEATVNSIDLEAGDEIAVFDSEIMVGAFTLTQVCTPENQFDNVLLAFSTLASGSTGYTTGNNVLFKCWDASLEIEITDFEINFDNPYGDAWIQSVFPADDGEYSLIHLDFEWIHTGNLAGTITDEINSQPIVGAFVEVTGDLSYSGTANANGNYLIEDIEVGTYSVTASAEGYFPKTINGEEILAGETTTLDFVLEPIIQTQTYNLVEGYQMISSRLISEEPNMQNILEGILDNLDFVRNSEGFMLRKIGPNWVNSIGDWVTTEGYLFKMNANDSFVISGEPVNVSTPKELNTGYQIISYLPSEPRDCEEVFTFILDNLDFVRNTSGFMLKKIGPFWVNNIGNMQPGEGYLVKMNADDVLTYTFTNCGDPFTDLRDGKIYNTVQIGNQCWMAENLNIGEMINGIEEMNNNSIIEKYCYDDDSDNCDEYGGLYQWDEMMQYVTTEGTQGICSEGWHIPTDDEWKILEGTVDSQYLVGDPIWNNIGGRGYDVGLNLKSVNGWYNNGNGIDLYGFSVLPSGFYNHNSGNFSSIGKETYIWTSTKDDNNTAWCRGLFYFDENVYRNYAFNAQGWSVRCLLD